MSVILYIRKYANTLKKLEAGAGYYESLSNGYEKELKEIKLILETPGLKPAVSLYCKDCDFVLQSPYNNDVLGCRKDVVCDSFRSKHYAVKQ